jgi:hypothetical protein
MATHQHALVGRINAVSAFLTSQQSLMSGEAYTSSMQAMATSIKAQIGGFSSISVDDATAVNSAITSSAFTNAQKSELAASVSLIVSVGDTPNAFSGCHTSKPQTQTMAFPNNYLTQADWSYIESPEATNLQICQCITDRLRRVGLTAPSDQTVANMAAMVACIREPDASQQRLRAIFLDFKAMRSSKVLIPGAHIYTYPPQPSGLEPSVFNLAYPSPEASPVVKELPEMAVLAARCPKRSTHKSIRAQEHTHRNTGSGVPMQEQVSQALVSFFNRMTPGGIRGPSPLITYLQPGGDGRSKLLQQSPHSESRSPESSPRSLPPCDRGGLYGSSNTYALALPDAHAHTKRSITHSSAALEHTTLDSGPSDIASDGIDAPDPVAMASFKTSGQSCNDAVVAMDPVFALERMAQHKEPQKKPASACAAEFVAKRPAGSPVATDSCKAAATHTAMKRPAASPLLLFGCSRCRGSATGCLTCRSPSFTGKRFQSSGN